MLSPVGALRGCPSAVLAQICGDPAHVVHQSLRTKRANGHHAIGLPGDAARCCGVRDWLSRSEERNISCKIVR